MSDSSSMATVHPDPAVILASAYHESECVPRARTGFRWPADHMRGHRRSAGKAVTALRSAGLLAPRETSVIAVSADYLADGLYGAQQ
ncbi:hypothetical protein [Actinoplanes sp. NPDC051494]|uniref:hypothetical protein n=1 Tax=Actinoplanes sp. NPDC051494 TaxID=3363907 RepID=UPI0037A8B31E